VSKLAIIHFAPLELYPPVQNLLQELERKKPSSEVIIFTTAPVTDDLRRFKLKGAGIKIIRLGRSGQKLGILTRYWNYLRFNMACLLFLIRVQPIRILYLETLSAFPAYIYRRFFRRNSELYIHYHEYTTPEEYRTGMKLTNYFHRLEKWLYPKARWVSHTNEYRMARFKQDIHPVSIGNPHILPNFPPKSWSSVPKPVIGSPVKVVYAGALSLTSMYTKEFAQWVIQQNGKVYWDVYTYNCTDDARTYLQSLQTSYIHVNRGVNYDELPAILKKYDVGVVLYNGHIPNYIYNAPNKLFEYQASGLAVWFPDVMVGSLPFCTKGTYPEIIALNFTRLSEVRIDQLIERSAYSLKESTFFCEEALAPLITKINS
jgi:hypothetical protein